MAEPGHADGAPARHVVYIVDDDVAVRQALSLLMTSVGYRPVAFAEGVQLHSARPRPLPLCERDRSGRCLEDLSGMSGFRELCELSERAAGQPRHFALLAKEP